MNIRQPIRAGSFYEASAASCKHHAAKLLDSVTLRDDLPSRLYGGLLPHAGWMYSGALAAETLKTLHAAQPLETIVLLGADHVGLVSQGEVYPSGVWRTPMGDVPVNQQLASALIDSADCLRANPEAHSREHSLEVQVPLIQVLAPEAQIVPIAVPPSESATEIGKAIGRVLAEQFPNACVIGSTDLTHHGGHFPTPGGHGKAGEQYTRANDRRMLDLVEALDAEAVVSESAAHQNACGAGAIAATVAACKQMGATRGICLHYTNSYCIVHSLYPDEADDTTVGYAAVVFA
ncbi:MAG: AmmeMemoRadiSam system protein B [Planctomycetota bacterium]|nr:AmmeMemoRadiSam system protein B [Planctomycetota bacterium]